MARTRAKAHSEVAPAPISRWKRPPAWLIVAGVPILLLGVYLKPGAPMRIGDGGEYLIKSVAAAEFGSLSVGAETIDRYAERLKQHPMPYEVDLSVEPGKVSGGLVALANGRYATLHFGFLSAVAAPFYRLCLALDLSFAHGFTLVHIVLLILLSRFAWLAEGWPGALAVQLLTVLSPMIWFGDKAHTEFLTYFGVTAAIVLLGAKRPFAAALALGFSATQNPPLAAGAAIILCWTIVTRRPFRFTRSELAATAATTALSVLSPVYNFAVFGSANILVDKGFVAARFITPAKIAALFIDPDIGLFPNWPLGLVLVGAGVALAYQRRSAILTYLQERPALALVLAVFAITVPPFQASQLNANAGGTVDISRYALWYIGLLYPVVVTLFELRGLALASLLLAAVPAAAVNVQRFSPHTRESVLSPSPFARWLYERFPGAFSPLPEVFIERIAGREVLAIPNSDVEIAWMNIGMFRPPFDHHWAFANPACTKIYVLADAFRSTAPDPELRPYGCGQPIASRSLFAALKDRAASGDFYFSLPLSAQDRFYDTLALGEPVPAIADRARNFLGGGWSAPESGYRWTKEERANIGFLLPSNAPARTALELTAFAYNRNNIEQTVRARVNGQDAGTYVWPLGSNIQTILIPLNAGPRNSVYLDLEILNPGAPVGDLRLLGIAATNFRLVAAP